MQMMQAVNPVKLKSVIKLIIVAVILLVAGVVTFNSYTIVQDGSVKVGTFLGKVNPAFSD
jgi:hypothetical protein